MATLTTHILDTANGCPASDVAVRLYSLDGERKLEIEIRTNNDGRSDEALMDFVGRGGEFELEFDIGDYFAARATAGAGTRFLDTVVIRFSMQPDESYHVPLLVSPWSYSTYRGS